MSTENVGALLAAVQNGKPWIDRFTKKKYAEALREYRERFAPLYREALLASGEDAAALAAALLDGLEAGWARQRPWNRTVAMIGDKQMIVCYLSPILLEDPLCAPLAEQLRDGWAARRPKEAYQITTAEELQKGFRATFLGITIPSKDE